MDVHAVVATLFPGESVDFNPAFYGSSAKVIKEKKLWRSEQTRPTDAQMDECWEVIKPMLEADVKNETGTWETYVEGLK